MDEKKQPVGPRVAGYPDSGDVSGRGRERRDDTEVFPQHRNRDELGTHGGPKRSAQQESEGYTPPKHPKKDLPHNKT